MRRVTGSMALAALTLLAGCAHEAPPQTAAVASPGGGPVAQRVPAVSCSTTSLIVATVSRCGSGALTFGLAVE